MSHLCADALFLGGGLYRCADYGGRKLLFPMYSVSFIMAVKRITGNITLKKYANR